MGALSTEGSAESMMDHRLQTKQRKKGVSHQVHGLRKTERVKNWRS